VTYAEDTIRENQPTPARIRLIGWLLAFAALPLFAVWAIVYGKEAGWDFQNYHWYDPYSLLTGRLGFDISVAHHATYYNPWLDVPLFLIATHLPAWAGGAWLGIEAGVGAALIGGIAYRLLRFENKKQRLAVSALIALAALTGGGAAGEIGKTSDDIASGLGAIAGLFVLVAGFDQLIRAKGRDLLWIGLAGFLTGASPGLKLTALPYAVGWSLGMLALPGTLWLRVLRTGVFGVGIILGMAVFGGSWYWTMWQYAANPVFPYFNDIFKSPLVGPGSFRDETFLPKDWSTRLLFPFLFSSNSLLVAEWHFRDIHILIAYIAVPIAAIASLFKRPPGRQLVNPVMARMLMAMAAGTYVVWIFLFGIYRYLVPLEMLSGVVIIAAIARLPIRAGSRLIIMVVLLGAAQIVAWKGDEPRFSWEGPYVGVNVPHIDDPANTMILLTETSPMGYVIPSFPKEIPFLRIQGWMVGAKDTTSKLGAEMHKRVAEHQGPILGLYWPVEYDSTIKDYADYGLKLDETGCKTVETNIQEPLNKGHPFLLCRLTRIAP
jgi:hypothetical protein